MNAKINIRVTIPSLLGLVGLIGTLSAGLEAGVCNYGSYQLPTDTVPTHYDIRLRPETSLRRYSGEIFIDVELGKPRPRGNLMSRMKKLVCLKPPCNANEDDGRVREIVLHADISISVTHVSFKAFGVQKKEKNGKNVKIRNICHDLTHQMIIITLEEGVTPGSSGRLYFGFKANIRDDMHGIYRSTYKTGIGIREYIVTQFHPTFARLAFPCFDEPHLKATVSLKLIADRTELASSSVSAADRLEIKNPIAIHSLAFAIGGYAISQQYTKKGIEVRILTVPSRKDATSFALDAASKALDWMEEYTEMKYPLQNFDIVAIPDHDTGSTGSWGLATIRDTLVLVDDKTSPDTKLSVAENVIKVVVQQWIGNIVTCSTWWDLDVIESIVAQKTFEILDDLYPQLNGSLLNKVGIFDRALHAEEIAKRKLTGIRKDMARSQDVYEAYIKPHKFARYGAASQLVSNLIGRDKFRSVIQTILRADPRGTVSITDFFEAIGKIDQASANAAAEWLQSSGHPVINAYESEGYVEIYAQDCVRAGSAIDKESDSPASGVWSIPIEFLFFPGNHNEKDIYYFLLEETRAKYKLQIPEWFNISMPGHWLKINPKPDLSNYHRIRYCPTLMTNIRQAIADNVMDPLDRMHILEDSIYLTKAGKSSPEDFIKLVDAYQNEDDDAVLLLLPEAYKLRATFNPEKEIKDAALEHILRLGGLDALNGVENLVQWKSRVAILDDQVMAGNRQIIDQALKVFDDSHGIVPVVQQIPVYDAVVKSGSGGQIDALFFLLQATESYDQHIRLARALARADNPNHLESLWAWMQQSDLKPDVLLSLVDVLSSTEAGRNCVNSHLNDVNAWKASPKPQIPTSGS